jgi:hypothetical protein
MLEQNNSSCAGDDMVIYRSWRVDAVLDLHPPTLWPRELIATVVGVTVAEVAVIEEVVADADKNDIEPLGRRAQRSRHCPSGSHPRQNLSRSCLSGREYLRDSLRMVS